MSDLQAPFPWFGGKSRAAELIWARFGDTPNYVEPFAGSLAVLLKRPHAAKTETVNDLDCFVANFWRALKHDPEAVAAHADNPVNEADLHARHVELVAMRETFSARMMGDAAFHDARVAGWWVWGLCCWIGSGWCSGEGPWRSVDGLFVKGGNAGMGVKRQLPHLGDAGRGVKRQLPHLGNAGVGVKRKSQPLIEWMEALAARLATVRVCCGDWSRVMGECVTVKHGITAVLLDPPYADTAGRDARLYSEDSLSVAHQVREWAIASGDNPKMRIALCGYEGEHQMPESWEVVAWRTVGGYASQSKSHDNPNAKAERVWFSPHCLKVEAASGGLFA